ncbi:dethiobiotin synthase [Marispirochaeta sp.]|jgi:dethiobiotin synthetase|uniref:dethiobiotin synthase n=1 Tax=Marispirochaeta sp. TaxID=2038653 RepID=UPI0029C732F8|nr:dethiobiotin synthase [Marispirochaeta sp.]
MAKGVFITGTDTDAGKTLITAALVRQIRMQGIDAVPMKIVQTGGGYSSEGFPISNDFDVYCAASSFIKKTEDIRDMVPYSFVAPASPHLAAQMENRICEIDPICSALTRLLEKYELVIAEGVGGVNVPLSENITTLALIQKIALPTLLVIRNSLGCINHALNTIDVLRSQNITIKGAIMTETTRSSPEDRYILQDNPHIIEKLGKIKILGSIPFIPNSSRSHLFWEELDTYMKEIAKYILQGVNDE